MNELSGVRAELDRLKHDQWMREIDDVLKPPVLKMWFQELTRRYHHDRTGSDREMKVVNEAYRLLQELLRKK
jgi:hypothetical protein